MSKKIFIIIISVVLAFLLISLIGYYFVLKGGTGETGAGGGIFRNFFPFGGNTPPTTESPIVEEPIVTPPISNYAKKLRLISQIAVAGAGINNIKAGSIVRHIEKGTGHIFETELFSPNQARISNTTLPMIYDALWDSSNNSIIARYLKEDDRTIDTYALLIKNVSTTTENSVTAIKYPEGLSDVSVSGTSVFSLEQQTGASDGYISNFDGSRRTRIWSSPIKELLSQYVNTRTVALTTKPHQSTFGFLFFVDTTNGQVKQILGGVYGLSTLTNDLATQVLYLDQRSTPQMLVYDIKSKTSTPLTPTTFPEKCVWSKLDRNIIYCAVPEEYMDNNSLTSWYRGEVLFTDSVWKYDVKNGTSSMLVSLYAEGGTQIDIIKPLLSPNEQYLVFINKIDDSLWSLDLTK